MTEIRPLLIRAGRIIDPATGFDGVADLLLDDGLVVARQQTMDAAPEMEVVEAKGCIVCPGFVDLHTHLRFPGFPEKETIASGTEAAATGGFTTVCAMANTKPVVDDIETLHRVLAEAERFGRVRVRQLAAVSTGLAGESLTDLAALAAAGAVAFSDDGRPVADSNLMRRALQESAKLGKVISVHEEEPAMVDGGVANPLPAGLLELPAWPCEGETSMVARDIALLKEVGGNLHIAHVSCAETVDLIREAQEQGLPVTAEVTPHHLRLTDQLVTGDDRLGLPPAHPNTKVNPPLRTERDAGTLVEALRKGVIGAIATDHAPHTAADKALPFERAAFGFTGLETALPLTLDLVRGGYLNLPTLIERLTTGPARIFRLDAGSLAIGSRADVCIFDPDAEWRLTPDTLRSKGKNTPLLGSELTGRVICTIVGGVVVYQAY